MKTGLKILNKYSFKIYDWVKYANDYNSEYGK